MAEKLNFGALTDHFGLETADLVLVGSTRTPVGRSVERATDECEDNVDIATHGQNAAGDLEEISNTYKLKSGTLNINTLEIGEINANQIAATLEIATSSGDWPTLTVTGQNNTETVVALTGKKATWSIPDSVELKAMKCAQPFAFTVGEGGKLTDATYTASVEIAQATDGLGVIVAHGVHGGTLAQSATMTRITAAPSWTQEAGWEDVQDPGADEPQAGFHTASMNGEKNLERDSTGV